MTASKKEEGMATSRRPPSPTLLAAPSPTAGTPSTDINGAYDDFVSLVPDGEAAHDNNVTDMEAALQFHRANLMTWQIQIANNTATS